MLVELYGRTWLCGRIARVRIEGPIERALRNVTHRIGPSDKAPAEMLSNERAKLECAVQKFRKIWRGTFRRQHDIMYRFGGCFLTSMPDSFVLSREKTQIEAARLFVTIPIQKWWRSAKRV